MAFLDSAVLISSTIHDLISTLIAIEGRKPKPVPHMPPSLTTLFGRRKRDSLSSTSASSTVSDVLDSPMSRSKAAEFPSHSKAEISSYNVTVVPTSPSASHRFVKRAQVDQRRRVLTWLSSPLTIYVLRMGLLSICLYSIGLNKASVEFYFRYSGLIAVILAQVILLLSLFSSSIVIKLYPHSLTSLYMPEIRSVGSHFTDHSRRAIPN